MSKCRDCGRTFLHGDVIIYGALGCYCSNRKNCFVKKSKLRRYKTFCANCFRDFRDRETRFHSKHISGFHICQKCSERENMPNIKITAEVDDKQVPLENISTETFEAIKALEKPKKIPVARIGHYKGDPNDRRLFLVISEHLREIITKRNDIKMVAIELIQGHINKTWKKVSDVGNLYENVKPL